jgi:hypothetical protein
MRASQSIPRASFISVADSEYASTKLNDDAAELSVVNAKTGSLTLVAGPSRTVSERREHCQRPLSERDKNGGAARNGRRDDRRSHE